MKQAVSLRCARATRSATSSGWAAPRVKTSAQVWNAVGPLWPGSSSSIEITHLQSGASSAAGNNRLASAGVETMAPRAPLLVKTWLLSATVLVV